jgi:hypothetical protein
MIKNGFKIAHTVYLAVRSINNCLDSGWGGVGWRVNLMSWRSLRANTALRLSVAVFSHLDIISNHMVLRDLF